MRCNCSRGGNAGAVVIRLEDKVLVMFRRNDELNIYVCLVNAFLITQVTRCGLVAHCTQSVTSPLLLRRQPLTAQKSFKYFLSVCSELVVVFGPEDVGRRRVEKISETVTKCCQRAGML